MVSHDKTREFEQTLAYLDYLAAFTNHEGVKKQQEWRESQKEGSIKESEDFIESARNNDFKNNPLIEAIKKLREADTRAKHDENIFSSMNLNKLISGDI